MLNKFTKILLVLTSLAPILLTYWFVCQVDIYNDSINLYENFKCNYIEGIELLISTFALALICTFLIYKTKRSLKLYRLLYQK